VDAPLVSILMPAYKPDYFCEALEAVVAQTHENLEILVGDNAGTGAIEAIVRAVNDPRITCIPSHAVSCGSPRLNHLLLWHRAHARCVRYVYDDDVIAPRSTAVLLDLLQRTPNCALAWHQREIIDENGNVTSRHGALAEDSRVVLDRALLLDNFTKFLNFVGEPSFVMLDRERAGAFDFNRYRGIETAFLWDISMYLEAARHGLFAGTGEKLGRFRVHGTQVSSTASLFHAVEWEYVFRQELAEGRLTTAQFGEVLPKLLGLYQGTKAEWPLLGAFQARLHRDAAVGRLVETLPEFLAEYRRLLATRGR
jgi:hypothetical protein